MASQERGGLSPWVTQGLAKGPVLLLLCPQRGMESDAGQGGHCSPRSSRVTLEPGGERGGAVSPQQAHIALCGVQTRLGGVNRYFSSTSDTGKATPRLSVAGTVLGMRHLGREER